MTHYFGVIGNRDHIKWRGEKRHFWEFLDVQPDGWLSSLVYARKDIPESFPRMIWDCGAWSYKHTEPKYNAQEIVPVYLTYAPAGSFVVSPDHILVKDCDMKSRRKWNLEQAKRFIDVCPAQYTPMVCIHGETIDQRIIYAEKLLKVGYSHFAVGGVAVMASQRKVVLAIVAAMREATARHYLHVMGLSSPTFFAEWTRLGVESCDGSSHFKQAFTGGAFFTREGAKLIKHKAARPGEPITAPRCECLACTKLRHGTTPIDTRTYGSNETNMGRAAHNMNMLMAAQKELVRNPVTLVQDSQVELW